MGSKRIVVAVSKEPMSVRLTRIAIECGISPRELETMTVLEFAAKVGEARARRS